MVILWFFHGLNCFSKVCLKVFWVFVGVDAKSYLPFSKQPQHPNIGKPGFAFLVIFFFFWGGALLRDLWQHVFFLEFLSNSQERLDNFPVAGVMLCCSLTKSCT